MFKISIVGVLCGALLVSGCEPVQRNPNTALGAAGGAAAGAAAGTLFGGDDRRNALIGAGIGLLAGGAVGQYIDQQKKQLQDDLAGSGAQIERQGDRLNVVMPASITFDTDSASIKSGFRSQLARVANTLQQYPKSYIDVVGHTDSRGAAEYNQSLSERRARSVAQFLAGQGVMAERIAAYGEGETQPVATNETESGRQQNRRVELVIQPAEA